MKGQQLEQLLEKTEHVRRNQTIDLYAKGTTVLYTGPVMNFNFPLAYNDSAPSPFERQSMLFEYGLPRTPEIHIPEIVAPKVHEIEITPYSRGMELDGGFNLYGNKTTAIIHDNYTDLDYHHHSRGGGSLNFGADQFLLPYEKQTRLNDF